MRIDQASADTSLSRTIPRRALLVTALVPLAPLGAILVFLALGIVPNPHGAGGMLLMLLAVAAAIAVLFECVLVPVSVARLMRNPDLRTIPNILSVAFGFTFVIVIGLFAWRFWRT